MPLGEYATIVIIYVPEGTFGPTVNSAEYVPMLCAVSFWVSGVIFTVTPSGNPMNLTLASF